MQDIERMLRDATADRWDGKVFERVSLDEAFNKSSIAWYRTDFTSIIAVLTLNNPPNNPIKTSFINGVIW